MPGSPHYSPAARFLGPRDGKIAAAWVRHAIDRSAARVEVELAHLDGAKARVALRRRRGDGAMVARAWLAGADLRARAACVRVIADVLAAMADRADLAGGGVPMMEVVMNLSPLHLSDLTMGTIGADLIGPDAWFVLAAAFGESYAQVFDATFSQLAFVSDAPSAGVTCPVAVDAQRPLDLARAATSADGIGEPTLGALGASHLDEMLASLERTAPPHQPTAIPQSVLDLLASPEPTIDDRSTVNLGVLETLRARMTQGELVIEKIVGSQELVEIVNSSNHAEHDSIAYNLTSDDALGFIAQHYAMPALLRLARAARALRDAELATAGIRTALSDWFNGPGKRSPMDEQAERCADLESARWREDACRDAYDAALRAVTP